MTHRLGIDIGGTFTDFALLDPASGRVAIHKALTTPDDPSRAVIEGTAVLLAREGLGFDAVDTLIHGTTLITNAVIERRGARTGMLVTRGFKDVIVIGREQRYDLFDLRLQFPPPLVDWTARAEIDARVLFDGTVETPLDLDQVRRAVADLIDRERIESLAVGLLHSYAYPEHERAIGALLAAEFPQLEVSLSSDVCPFMREYERWTTTLVNAYTQPLVDRYLKALEDGLAARGFRGSLLIMTSSGGSATPATARRLPVRLIESGPAAGALMVAHLGAVHPDAPALLSFDMGGTTAKGALIRDHELLRKHELEVARVHAFKKGSGLPLKIPAIDMIEIGAGGGGIAAVDGRGVIRLGPRSAGAVPGPACYGRGGEAPTLTDANLLLGYLDPGFFLGGTMALDREASRAAIARAIGGPLGLETARAAWGIHETANEDVARAFRVHAAERGFDYRGCMMVAFGGSGPPHALRIARKLRVPTVMFAAGAGVMSAIGLLVSPLSHEVMWSDRIALADLTADELERRFAGPTAEAAAVLHRSGVPPESVTVARRLDMRYRGQGYEIEVPLPAGLSAAELLATLPQRFAAEYARVFSISFLDQPLEIVNWKLEVAGPRPVAPERRLLVGTAAAPGTAARKGSRPAWFPTRGGYVDTPVWDRYALRPGDTLAGPALIEENESTCVIGDGDRVTVDDAGNLIATVAVSAEQGVAA